ncbi:LysR family transcriptional regulator [Hoeflea poritis]|uniref:LysR family transcriptional regulator n=1 Tax=Hoeflea poritis TaxID=2993659 RepID=A0ABT4VRQ8_9HYPH|nr:LysR family transcriptional regulator [Hoeflea poritis]MDA4846713.1 LysR family transcriptional regulator [Hoeflea poritis]
MRRRLPPLNALLAFEAAARHSNFTRAAEELGVAQPAITRHINNIESWLGIDLFRRTGNAVMLTADGESVSELVTTAFDRLEISLGALASSKSNEITIGASFGITHLWLMPQITAMRGAARGAAINFITSENYVDFDAGKVDFSIRFGSGDWPGKRADLLFTETTYVIAAPAFLQNTPEIDPDNLAATLRPEWLLEHGDMHDYGWMTWRKWFEQHGSVLSGELRNADIRNYPTLLDMVRCGEGVALGYVGLDNHLVEAGEILRLGKPVKRPNLGYYLLTNAGDGIHGASKELWQYLTCEAGQTKRH